MIALAAPLNRMKVTRKNAVTKPFGSLFPASRSWIANDQAIVS